VAKEKSEKNLLQILKNGYIDNSKKKSARGLLDEYNINQIFSQLVYKNIPNQRFQTAHWLSCCIVLDKKILRDYPFYATGLSGYYQHFKEAFQNKENKDIYQVSLGKRKRIPSLTRLKKEINKYTRRRSFDNTSFIHSHEILFGQKIYLKDYCKCITYLSFPISVHDEESKKYYSEIKKLQKACLRRNIPLKEIYISKHSPMKGIGINNFIKKVEESI
jgi:hypothetical protein